MPADRRVQIRIDCEVLDMPFSRDRMQPCCWRVWSTWFVTHGIDPDWVWQSASYGIVRRDLAHRRVSFQPYPFMVVKEPVVVQLESPPMKFPICSTCHDPELDFQDWLQQRNEARDDA